jgi:hypothetical protein
VLIGALGAGVSFAQVTCPSGDFNMLDWMTLNNATTEHLYGPQDLPLYTILPDNNLFWWIKGDHSNEGYPWDVQYYGNSSSGYIYQWITDYDPYSYTNPTYYKAFDTQTTMPWTPICVPALGAGNKLSSITIPSSESGYSEYSDCSETQHFYLGNTVNQVWNYGNLDIGGNIGTQPDLELSYRYSCDDNYDNCTYEEVYDFMQNYGEVRWTYYELENGSYVQQNQTVFNEVESGGSPPADFPCGLP